MGHAGNVEHISVETGQPVFADLGFILHSRHQYHWHTGYIPPQPMAMPHLGAVVSKTLGPRNPDMPPFIAIGQTVEGPGEIEIRFPHLPLRPRQYVLRLSITDQYQLASYDVVTAGPRFAITGQGAGVDSLADEQDGLVTLPFEVSHRVSAPQIKHRLGTD